MFSFRNSLEVKIFVTLEKKVKELNWKLDEDISNWYAETTSPAIMTSESQDEVHAWHREHEGMAMKRIKELISRRIGM